VRGGAGGVKQCLRRVAAVLSEGQHRPFTLLLSVVFPQARCLCLRGRFPVVPGVCSCLCPCHLASSQSLVAKGRLELLMVVPPTRGVGCVC